MVQSRLFTKLLISLIKTKNKIKRPSWALFLYTMIILSMTSIIKMLLLYLQTITVYEDFVALCQELEAFENN